MKSRRPCRLRTFSQTITTMFLESRQSVIVGSFRSAENSTIGLEQRLEEAGDCGVPSRLKRPSYAFTARESIKSDCGAHGNIEAIDACRHRNSHDVIGERADLGGHAVRFISNDNRNALVQSAARSRGRLRRASGIVSARTFRGWRCGGNLWRRSARGAYSIATTRREACQSERKRPLEAKLQPAAQSRALVVLAVAAAAAPSGVDQPAAIHSPRGVPERAKAAT
jgi:hypothetical protein